MDNELFEKAPIPEAYFSLAMPVVLSMLVDNARDFAQIG